MSLSIGQKIELNDGRIARVRFLGTTSFQAGDWVGVELEDDSGKNDGAVKGDRYFTCEPGYGMFLRASGVKRIIDEPKTKDRPTSNGAAVRSRPSSMYATNGAARGAGVSNDAAANRRASTIAPSPTPGARAGLGVRSPTKQLNGVGGARAVAPRTTTPSTGNKAAPAATARSRMSVAPTQTVAATRRMSTLPPATGPTSRAPRPSVGGPTATPRSHASRPSVSAAAPARAPPRAPAPSRTDESSAPSTSSTLQTDDDASVEEGDAKVDFAPRPPPPPPIPEDTSQSQGRARRPSSPTAASIHSQRTIRSSAASSRQIEELEAKLRLMERKRLEDRDLKKNLEQAQQERDQYKNIIEKLQNKYRPQQQEITELRRSLADAEKRTEHISALQAEHDSIMELATIDREMAEEKAQSLEEQLESLRSKTEEMQLELEILREENGELGKEMSPEERTSAGWLQMEKSNERLREALLRLRDITQDREEELRESITSLESQLKDFESNKVEHEDTREKLLRTEADVSDLRQQLEAAQESEEMIEQLSEQKTGLEERIHQLRNTIEELEELRELNDELVINHQEEEKQMQEELDFKDSLLTDRERTSKQQQEALDQADYTISRYRTLVSELQASLQDMQASKQLSEAEAADLNNRSRAMLELNMKLQTSAAKTQVKTIDLELKRLDAQEASEHLGIVQLFLPEAFEAERDSVLALLRLKRISFKATLMQGFVRERITSFGTRGREEDVFAACHVVEELDWIASKASCFVNSIYRCSPDEFSQYRSVLHEVEPIERALNGYIDGLRRDELNEAGSAEELERSIAVMMHLATIHLQDNLPNHADDLLMRAQFIQTQLESAAVAMGLIRGLVEDNTSAASDAEHQSNGGDDDDDEVTSDLQLIVNRAEALVGHFRGVKVTAGKLYRSLTDLEARSLTLEASWTASFEGVEKAVGQAVIYARQAGAALHTLFGEEGRTDPFTPQEISRVILPAAMSQFELPSPESGPFNAVAGRLHDLGELLNELASNASDLDNTVEFERAPPPWVARAEELKRTKATSVDVEAQLTRALDGIRDRDGRLKDKETELEEQSVRIEMLEARMKDASKRSARIAELERTVHESRDAEKKTRADLVRARQEASRELDQLKDELTRLAAERRRLGPAHADGEDGVAAEAMGAATRLTIQRQTHRIAALEGAVRHLHDENRRRRLPTPSAPLADRHALDWLHQPLLTNPRRPRRGDENDRSVELASTVQKRTQEVFAQLVRLVASPDTPHAATPDLTALPANKLGWRPARETARWQVERQKEDWAAWKSARDGVVRSHFSIHRATTVETNAPRGHGQRARRKHAAPVKNDDLQDGHVVEIVHDDV